MVRVPLLLSSWGKINICIHGEIRTTAQGKDKEEFSETQARQVGGSLFP